MINVSVRNLMRISGFLLIISCSVVSSACSRERKAPRDFTEVSEQLVRAASVNSVEHVTFMLEKGAKLNYSRIRDGFTALIAACVSGHKEAVDLLLGCDGIDVNAFDRYGVTPLIAAAYSGHLDIVERLLALPAVDVDAFDSVEQRTALSHACRNDHLQVVRVLLASGRCTLENLEHRDIFGKRALELSLQPEIRKEVFDHMAKTCNFALIGSLKDSLKDLELSLELHEAASTGNLEKVQDLVTNRGSNVNRTDREARSALSLAAYAGHEKVVEFLLSQQGIDINSVDSRKMTALMWACVPGHFGIVNLLLNRHGIDFNAADSQGGTALMYASYAGYVKIVKLLLKEVGIEVNAKNKSGSCALLKASLAGHEKVVKLLLEYPHTDSDICDIRGYAAFILAQQAGYSNISDLLSAHTSKH
jgi:ankyrin repeat protein